MNEKLHDTSHVGHMLFVILAFLIGGVLGLGVGVSTQKSTNLEDTSYTNTTTTKSTATPTASASPSASATATADPTAGWKSYTIPNLSLSFKYPAEWGDIAVVTDTGDTGKTYNFQFSNLYRQSNDVSMGYSTSDISIGRAGPLYEQAAHGGYATNYPNCNAYKAYYDPKNLTISECKNITVGAKTVGYVLYIDYDKDPGMFSGQHVQGFYYTGNSTYPAIAINSLTDTATLRSQVENVIRSIH